MVDPLATAIIVGSLVLAGWALLTAARGRLVVWNYLYCLAAVELATLVLAGLAVAAMVRGERVAEPATFLGYLIVALLVLPGGAWLAILERTRWGTILVGLSALVLPVLVIRLQQVWHG